jgi:type I restriction-modification system DNA methylase subunit/predicted type IV restriction endonuclease
MSTPQEIIALTERFDRNREAYTSGQYNETQLRREFLDPFFEALGWDVNNKKGYAEAYKEVIHEDAIKIGGYTKAPDYCFRIGGTRKFFVEAKKPSVNLKDDISPAFQLRRYAWSARLPLSILTDFEEFAVYDCRIKPDKADKSSTARILYSTFSEYQKRWDEISSIFSLDAILKGSFDKYVESGKGKKGTAEVDAAFLKEIESWRELLARNIALRNPSLTQRELNFSVQQTIDRIIFLRICEDRGMEEYGHLQSALNGTNVYQRLCQIFRQADDKYNSGLFHFTREKEREEPDELTLNLTIDDNPLKDIIKSLYYPDSPYEFSVLPADILGQVYEQFLGKVIRLTDGHRAVVEDKPEVKKAGGVYYTPTYIVDYIVKNTVGTLLGNSECPLRLSASAASGTRNEINSEIPDPKSALKKVTTKDVSKIRILDPACGSGSFLIGAYQYLLDWHLQYYSANDPESWTRKKNPPIFDCGIIKSYRLTTAEKKRILLNNIYGVDIDPQAVEVTKLSLLLKVLEGESDETLSKQLKLFQERALPDLGNNIKCGNSLIGPDFYNNSVGAGLVPAQKKGKEQKLPLLDDEERYRINVFDWNAEFPEIMKAGGFDTVIGNPPYGAEFTESAKSYFANTFKTAVWRGESYLLFVERAIELLKKGGLFGYIIPDTYLNLGFTQSLRGYLLKNTILREIVSLPSKVFMGATVDTTLLFTEKATPAKTFHEAKVRVKVFNKKLTINSVDNADREFSTSVKVWQEQNAFNINTDSSETNFILRIEDQCKLVSDLAEMFSGIKVYEVGKGTPPQTEDIRNTKPFTSERKANKSFYPFFDGKHIGRYTLLWEQNNWLNYGPWLAAPRNPQNFEGEKILIRKIVALLVIRGRRDPAIDSLSAEVRRILGLDPLANDCQVVYGAIPRDNKEIAIMTRSILEVLVDISTDIEVPASDVQEKRVSPTFAETAADAKIRPLVRIQSSPGKPADAFVSVSYRDSYFWIDDRDYMSKKIFSFLMFVFTLVETGEKGAAPIVTIPTG